MQRAQHRLHARRVEGVGVAVLGEPVGVQHRRQRQHGRRARGDGAAAGSAARRLEAAGPRREAAVQLGWRRVAGGAHGEVARRRRAAGVCWSVGSLHCGAHGEQRVQQPVEVVLVVPGPDRRPQPRRARGCCARRPRARPAARARPRGRGSRRRRACVSPRGATARGRARPAARPGARPASRARSCTAGQPADSSTRDRRQRAGDRLGAQRHRVEAPRVLVQAGVEPGVRVGQVARSRAASTARRSRRLGLTYSMPVPSGPHSHFWPGAGVGVAAERAHVDRRPRRRPGRRRAAPAPPACASSAGASSRSSSPRASRRPGACCGPTASAISAQRHLAHAHAAQLPRGRQRAEQARGAPRRW